MNLNNIINWDALEQHWVTEIENENILREQSQEKVFDYGYY